MKSFLAHALLAFIVIGSFYLIYIQSVEPVLFPPITFRVDIRNFQTDKEEYHRGDTVYIHTSFCRDRSFEVKSSWYLIDHTKIAFPDTDNVFPKGCIDALAPIGVVPSYAPFGAYHLEGAAQIKVNNLSTLYYDFKSIEFEVR